MALSGSSAARCCAALRHRAVTPLRPSSVAFSRPRRTDRSIRRSESTDAASGNPKIASIVDQIGQLTLLETADLVSSLKTRLNIPDMPMASALAAAPAAPAAAAAEEEEAAPAAQEKTLFNLKLQSFETGSKPKIIKEIKNMLGLSLVDSKKFVESAPKVMREGVPKEEAEKIVETLKGLGGVAIME
ncbi:MAG: hypothetical protein M4579_000529 [Chaenotheca gracillima]|nr:MAG: hypothetical protein M4579_000529 [Chaenotheca gracillima]